MAQTIRNAIITIVALIAFAFIADRIVCTVQTWKCLCHLVECEWCGTDEMEWDAFHREAEAEYIDEFTALFNSYEVKRAKTGALMIRQGSSGSFKFAKKGK